MPNPARSLAVVLAGSAVVYTWPLLRTLTTSIPGGPTDLDVVTMVWNVGYVFRALATGGDLLRTDDVLVPFGADLRLHTYGLLQGLVAAPVVAIIRPVGAFNLMLLATLVLNGVLTYLLIKQESGSRPAALVAGTCFMLATPLLDQIRVGRPTFASLWIVAGSLLVAGSIVRQPRLWKGIVLGLVLVAALLTDFQIVLFCAAWLLIYGLARFRRRHAGPLIVAALFAGVPFGLVVYPALQNAAGAGYPQPTSNDMLEYSFRIWDYADPQVLPHAYGVELGAAALIGALVSRRVWLVGGLVCLVLALGPALQPTSLPLPFAVLSSWPPLAQFRTPYRLAMPATLGFSVLLGILLARVFSRWPVWSRTVAAGLLVIGRLAAALAFDPLTTQAYPSYAFYTQLAAEQGHFAVLEVPFGVRSGLERIGEGGEALEYYQLLHGKPVVNGMIARLPSSVFQAYRSHPALRLLAGEDVDDDALHTDLDGVLGWVGARYVVVHHRWLSSAQTERIDAFLNSHPGLERVLSEADIIVYARSYPYDLS